MPEDSYVGLEDPVPPAVLGGPQHTPRHNYKITRVCFSSFAMSSTNNTTNTKSSASNTSKAPPKPRQQKRAEKRAATKNKVVESVQKLKDEVKSLDDPAREQTRIITQLKNEEIIARLKCRAESIDDILELENVKASVGSDAESLAISIQLAKEKLEHNDLSTKFKSLQALSDTTASKIQVDYFSSKLDADIAKSQYNNYITFQTRMNELDVSHQESEIRKMTTQARLREQQILDEPDNLLAPESTEVLTYPVSMIDWDPSFGGRDVLSTAFKYAAEASDYWAYCSSSVDMSYEEFKKTKPSQLPPIPTMYNATAAELLARPELNLLVPNSIFLSELDTSCYSPAQVMISDEVRALRDEVDARYGTALRTASTTAFFPILSTVSLSRLASRVATNVLNTASTAWRDYLHISRIELRAIPYSQTKVLGDNRPQVDRASTLADSTYIHYKPFVIVYYSDGTNRISTNPVEFNLRHMARTTANTWVDSDLHTQFRDYVVNTSLLQVSVHRKTLSLPDASVAMERAYRLMEASESHQEMLGFLQKQGYSAYRDTLTFVRCLITGKPPAPPGVDF